MSKLLPVKSLGDLRQKAKVDERYAQLVIDSAANLGGDLGDSFEQALNWLEMNAMETSEEGVVEEINFMLER